MNIKCPNCGKQIDRRVGYVNEGRVFICEEGRPLARKTKYYCRNCGSTIIFIKKCEPE
ncbi:MAG: hypothetical protein ACLTAM_03320 [Collinsella sp.]